MTDVTNTSALEAARILADLSIEELWLRYLELIGLASVLELEGYLLGALVPDRYEYNVIAQALNERFMCRRRFKIDPAAQQVVATSSGSFSDGFMNPSVLRGRLLRLAAIRARSSAMCIDRSVPFGMY